MRQFSDAQLMLRTSRGDLDAFAEIVRRHQETAWRTAYRFLGDTTEAEDITQEAFLKILAAAPRYRPTAAFSTYLYSVVSRLCIDFSRKKRPLTGHVMPDRPDTGPGPDTILIHNDQKQREIVRGDELP